MKRSRTSAAELTRVHPGLRRRTVGEIADLLARGDRSTLAVKNAIYGCYLAIGEAVAALMRWKKKHGYCRQGISCMNWTDGAFACKEHKTPKRASLQYTTVYGKIRKRERDIKRLAKETRH